MATTSKAKVWEGGPELRRSLVAVDDLEPFPGNPRRGDVDSVKGSLRRFGQTRPILVDKTTGRIIAGHHVRLAAIELGWTHVAVTRHTFRNAEEAHAYLVADNGTHDAGGYDLESLVAQIKLVGLSDYGLEGTGYTPVDLHSLERDLNLLVQQQQQEAQAARDLDDAPPLPPRKARSKKGEVYELGAHRLLCGDSRDREQLEKLMVGAKAAAMWTDPPYGVGYTGKTAEALTIENDSSDGTETLLALAFAAVDPVLSPGAPIYIASPAGVIGITFRLQFIAAGWRLHQTLVWDKQTMVLGYSDYHYAHEDVLYGWKPGPGRQGRGRHRGSRWYGSNNQTSMFSFPKPSRSAEHPTMKPVGLVAAMITNSTRKGDVVLDPFGGSGSTLIACEELGRRCYAVELDPRYCDVIRDRYAALAA